MIADSSVVQRSACNSLAVYAALLLSLLGASPTAAQDYPTRPIRLIVAFSPGGTTDFVARIVAEKAGTMLGQTVVVENKPGANGAVAADLVMRSEPDGYTLFFTTLGAMAINPTLKSNLSYNPRTDFEPVAMVARNTILLAVNSASATTTFNDFVALTKSKKSVSVGVTGIGAATYLSAILLQKALATKLEIVPYRGASQALTDLLGGHIDAMFGDIPVLLASIKAGKARALVSASSTRVGALPDVPTFAELGFPNVLAENWAGVVAPAHTPPAVVSKLGAILGGVMENQTILHQLALAGVTPAPTDAQKFQAIISGDIERWGRIIRENGLRTD